MSSFVKLKFFYNQYSVEFLGLKWFDGLIHHEEHIGSDISLSSLERSTDQVVKATYTTGMHLIIYTYFIRDRKD